MNTSFILQLQTNECIGPGSRFLTSIRSLNMVRCRPAVLLVRCRPAVRLVRCRPAVSLVRCHPLCPTGLTKWHHMGDDNRFEDNQGPENFQSGR